MSLAAGVLGVVVEDWIKSFFGGALVVIPLILYVGAAMLCLGGQ